MGLVGSSELNILANFHGAIYSGKCCKLHHCTATMFHLKEAIYTDSWLFVFLCRFQMFSVSSLGGGMEAKQAFYMDLVFTIYAGCSWFYIGYGYICVGKCNLYMPKKSIK